MQALARTGKVLRILALVILVWLAYIFYQGFGAGMAIYLHSRAIKALGDRRIPEGIELLNRASHWDENHLETTWLLAREAMGRDDRKAARQLLLDLRGRGEVSIAILDALARLHEESGELDQARQAYEELLRRHPASHTKMT